MCIKKIGKNYTIEYLNRNLPKSMTIHFEETHKKLILLNYRTTYLIRIWFDSHLIWFVQWLSFSFFLLLFFHFFFGGAGVIISFLITNNMYSLGYTWLINRLSSWSTMVILFYLISKAKNWAWVIVVKKKLFNLSISLTVLLLRPKLRNSC